MTYKTNAYFLREYRKRYGVECDLSQFEVKNIIDDAHGLSDNGVVALMALHVRVNRHSRLIDELERATSPHRMAGYD